jgi:predicted ATPase
VLDISPEDVDAIRFERLANEGRALLRLGDVRAAHDVLGRAEALWRGPALEELDADWARAESARLTQIRLDVLEDRIDADLRLGRHREVVGEIESLLTEHPYREALWAHLMLALYRCGRQTDALAAFQQARTVLSDELGLEPGPELRAREAAVLNQDPDLDWSPAVGSPRPGTAASRGNLPIALTTFVGRDEELIGIRRAITRERLVTVTGAAGSGKTRLAVEAGHALVDDFPDGVWLVALEPVSTAGAVPHVVAATLADGATGRLSESRDRGPATAGAGLLEFLRPRRLLLVLDGCEHLVPGVSDWVQLILSTCPGLRLLATSREPLGILGEVQQPLPPLSIPGQDDEGVATLSESEAVRLFADRAHRVSGFELTAENAATVAELCRHLDGLPLAIELAAARTKALPVAFIAAELHDRFSLLVSPGRGAPTRHRSLKETVDWSYELLDDDERSLFRLLSVFQGGCSLESAMALARVGDIAPARVLDLLAGLVDKSLVVLAPEGRHPTARYEMLETLREYGREQLKIVGLWDEARRAHRRYVVALAEEAEAGLMTAEYRLWQSRVESELGNVRAAYESAISSGDHQAALRTASALWWFWSSSDRQALGRAWIDSLVRESGVRTRLRARALTTLCYLAGQQLDLEAATAAGEQALSLWDPVDEWSIAWTKQSLGLALAACGDHRRAASLLVEARAVMDAHGEHWYVAANDLISCVRALVSGDVAGLEQLSSEVLRRVAEVGYEPFRCWGHLLRSRAAEQRGDLASARSECERALTAARLVQLNHYVAFALVQLGRTALLDDDSAAAEGTFREAIMAAEAGGAGWFAALARVGLADVLRAEGDEAGAVRLLEEVVAWGERTPGGPQFFFTALGGDPRAQAAGALEQTYAGARLADSSGS